MNDLNSSDLDLELDSVADGKGGGTTQTATSTVPEKYKGKSVEDIIKMHENAERLIASQGNELGGYRRLVMQAPPVIADKTKPVERAPVTVDSLVNDPDKAILEAVSTSPVAKALETQTQRLNDLERSADYNAFNSDNPTWQADVQDPAFLAWVQKNPLRQQLAGAADQKNFKAAANLWDLWREHKELVGNVNQERKEQKFVEASTTRTGATEQPAATVYSSAKLMELRMRAFSGDDHAAANRWREIQPDLIAAYKEGRVK